MSRLIGLRADTRWSRSALPWLAGAWLASLVLTGCPWPAGPGRSAPSSRPQPADDEPADDEPGESDLGAAPLQPRPINAELDDELTVPDGTPDQLARFIEQLSQMTPQGATSEAIGADIERIMLARLVAAEKILSQRPEPEFEEIAVETKLDSLRALAIVGDAAYRVEFQQFISGLLKSSDPERVLLGRCGQFQLRVDQLANGELDNPQAVLDDLKKLVALQGAGTSVFIAGRQAAVVLQQTGMQTQAVEMLRIVGHAFQDHPDSGLADEAAALLEQAELFDFQTRLAAMLSGEPGALPQLLASVRRLLAKRPPSEVALEMSSRAAQMLEYSGHAAQASQVYAAMQEAIQDLSDPTVAGQVGRTVEMASRRMQLVGKPLQIDGMLADGSPLDWSSYAGKVVLVDFWATWCGPCLREIPNIQENYARYREKGFEVLGVNLDENRADVQQFFENEGLPWPTVFSDDPNANGFENPNAVRCGVEAIPFLVLVGADGKVAALHVRGPQLGAKLAELLGPADPRPDQPAADEPAPNDLPADEPPPEEGALPDVPLLQGHRAPPAGGAIARAGVTRREMAGASALGTIEVAGPQATVPAVPVCGNSAPDDDHDADRDATADDDEPAEEAFSNPYEPSAEMTPRELVEFLLEMQDKPSSIQHREGFSQGVIAAADRVLAADVQVKWKTIALLARFHYVHRDASLGDEAAQKELGRMTEQWADDARPEVQEEVRFLRLEQRSLDSRRLSPDEIAQLVEEVVQFLEDRPPGERHLRLASSAVEAINRLDDGEQRETWFRRLGEPLAKSTSRPVARYGKRLARGAPVRLEQLVGKELMIEGATVDGTALDWASYRGKVVLVDFWATWCGPCLEAMPQLEQLRARYTEQGFEIVGISLDEDLDALASYLEENPVAWTILAGPTNQQLAERCGVRGIPALVLVDSQRRVVAVGHSVAEMERQVQQMLAPADDDRPEDESPDSP